MTPKEALKGIKQRINYSLHKPENVDTKERQQRRIDKSEKQISIIEQALNELEELKRVPTAKEVCEAIQENLTLRKIVYNEKDNSFGLEYGIPPLYLPLVESKERFITYFPFATPKILILIGKFYEGQVKADVS